MTPAASPPTRVRFGVLGFACTLSMITYLDRVCFGSAAGELQKEFGLSEDELGMVFTAFALAYAAFEIPSGWLGDVFGPRRTLIRIVLWWSLFTALTGSIYPFDPVYLDIGPWHPAITPLIVLIVVRFLFGMGEAGAYPNLTRALHNWFPHTERGSAQGAVWMSGRFMGGMTPLIWLLLVTGLGLNWRTAFYLFGVIGALWCVAFWIWFRDRPREKPEVNDEELALIEAGKRGEESAHSGVPWSKLLLSANLWALCLMYFCCAYGWYFNITYLPKFMDEQYDQELSGVRGALYKGGPLWLGALTCLVGGVLSDKFIAHTGNRKWGRRLFGVIGHTLCGVCYLLCLTRPGPTGFFLAISFAAFWNDLTMGSAWATCQDIGRKYAAIVAGFMNTVGNLGGAVAGTVTGKILQAKLAAGAESIDKSVEELSKDEKREFLLQGYNLNFLIFALVYFLAVALWFRVDATVPIEPDNEARD